MRSLQSTLSFRATTQRAYDSPVSSIWQRGSQLDQALRAFQFDGHPNVMLDLSALSFMDSTGLRAIVEAQRRTTISGGTLVIRKGPKQVQRIFDLAGVAHILTFEEDDSSYAPENVAANE